MPDFFSYTCSCCGNTFDGAPSIGFRYPFYYETLSEEQRGSIATLTEDLCTISDEESTDYFIRTVLEIPIEDVEDPFTWGVWVSLSKKSFDRYVETYNDPVEGESYFGWFSNRLPYYENTLSIPTTVIVRVDNARPWLWLNREGDHELHELVVDQQKGITVEKAVAIAQEIGHLG